MNLPFLGLADNAHVRLTISSATNTSVSIYLTAQGTRIDGFVQSNRSWEVELPRSAAQNLSQEERRSIRSVLIGAGEPITVTATFDGEYFSESFILIPYEGLGTRYRVTSIAAPPQNTFGGVVTVIATENDTELRITPTVTTASGNSPGFTYGRRLNQYDVYQIVPSATSGTDLSGTLLEADKPIVVIGGHAGGALTESDATNPLIESFLPVHRWGRDFFSIPFPDRDSAIYVVVADQDGTTIDVNGAREASLDAGESLRFSVAGPAHIVSNRPIQLAQFDTHRPADTVAADSDPAMTLVQPKRTWGNTYLWTSPGLGPRIWPVDPTDETVVPFEHVLLVTAERDGTGPIRLDGVDISLRLTTAHSDGRHVSGIIPIDSGRHTLTSGRPVGALLLGRSHHDAYATPAGFAVPPPVSLDSAGGRTCEASIEISSIIRNSRFDTVRVVGIDFDGIDGTLLSPSVPRDLTPYSNLDIRIRIAGLSVGMNSGLARIRLENGDEITAPISVERFWLRANIVEDVLDLPDATTADPIGSGSFRLTNTGQETLTFISANDVLPFEIVDPSFPFQVAPGDTVEVTVRYAPNEPGSFEKVLEISTEPCNAPATVRLRGRRTGPANITISSSDPPTLLCPDEFPGLQYVNVTNTGSEDLLIDSVKLSAGEIGRFELEEGYAGRTIPPGTSLRIAVRFIPDEPGEYSATLRIQHNVSPGFSSVTVSGRKDSVGMKLSVDSIDFGDLLLCEGGSTSTLSLSNTGTVPLPLGSIAFTSGRNVSVTSEPSDPIAIGSSGEIGIRFEPTALGETVDTIVIQESLCGTTIRLPVAGRATAPAFSTDTDMLDFGDLPACHLPDTLYVTVTNLGDVTGAVRTIEASDAVTILRTEDNEILPGENFRIGVVVRDDFNGDLSESMTIGIEPCGLELTVGLRGTVSEPSVRTPIGDVVLPPIVHGLGTGGTTTIVNTGILPIRLDSIPMAGAPEGLSIISPTFPVDIEPGDSIEVSFRYRSEIPETFRVEATLSASPCPIPVTFSVLGSAIIPKLQLMLPDTSGVVNSVVRIPVRLISEPLLQDSVWMAGHIRWNFRNLQIVSVSENPFGSFIVPIGDITAGERVTEFHYFGRIPEDGIIGEIEMLVLLGETDHTPIDVSLEAAMTDSISLDVEVIDGDFRTLGICMIDGERYVLLPDEPAAGRPRPNPARDQFILPFVSSVTGDVSVTLYDYAGVEVGSAHGTHLTEGAGEIPVDVSHLPTGHYMFRFGIGEFATVGEITIVR